MTKSSTLGKWLKDAGFDFKHGVIVFDNNRNSLKAVRSILRPPFDLSKPLFSKKFDAGFGTPEAPMIVAYDKTRIYYIGEYDGSTCLESLPLDPQRFIDYPELDMNYASHFRCNFEEE